MGLAAIIFSANNGTILQEPETGKAVLTIDATIQSNHSLKGTLTRRELEDGVNVNDHMTVEPESLTINGVISETPLDLFQSAISLGVGASAGLLSKQLGSAGAAVATGLLGGSLLSSVNGSRTVNSFEQMTQLLKKRVRFTIVTGLKTYSNMMLTSVDAVRSAQIGKALNFTAMCEQVTFVTSKLITLGEGDMLGIGSSAAGSTNLGKQAASEASSDTSSNGSILFNAFGSYF